MQHPRFKRILLKLSGEALMGDQQYGIDSKVLTAFAQEVAEIHRIGVQIGLVIGGGNIIRGDQAAAQGIDKVSGDYMGMLATVINAIAMQNALEQQGIPTRLQTSIAMAQIAEPYIRRRAMRHLEKNRVVIFGAGTGNPYFTTDTTAVLRAIEIESEVVIKGTKVDGIYDADPVKVPTAKRFDKVTFDHVIENKLSVMDFTAMTLCRENGLPILVFNMNVPGNLKKLILGDTSIATIVGNFK